MTKLLHRAPFSPARRAFVLLTVLVIIVIASLIGTSVLYVADAQRGAASLNLEQAQLRSLAWSGVQATMAELDGQRSTLLKGEKPTLTNSWKLWEGSVGGSITLAVIGPEGATVSSEASKLDLNIATAEMLAKLPGIGEETAAKIAGARANGFGSPEELGRIDGLTASLLHEAPADDLASSTTTSTGTGPKGLLTQTTVFAFDPNFDESGEAKINISNGWTDELREPLAQRLGEELAKTLEPALKSAGTLAKEADLIALLLRLKVPQNQWEVILAAITTSDEEFSRGKVDINQAPVDVLAAIPGIDRPTAEKLVDARARLGTEDRQKVTWPLTQGVMKDEDFQKAAAWITTRSLQWRVRVEARLERNQSPSDSDGSTLRDASETLDPPGMVWEAVIDVSDTRPRVAYLRDVTHLPGLIRQALVQETAAETSVVAGVDSTASLQSSAQGPGPKSVSDLAENERTKSNAKLNTKSMKGQSLKLGSGLDLKNEIRDGARSEDAASPPVEVEPTGGTPPPASKDRRIGRWRGTSKE